MSKTRYKNTGENKIIRSCYFQTSVLIDAIKMIERDNLAMSSFVNYCLKLCTEDPSLFNEAKSLYLLDRSKALRSEIESREKLDAANKKLIKVMLKKFKGNKTRTAKEMRISVAGLCKQMDKYNIRRNAYSNLKGKK